MPIDLLVRYLHFLGIFIWVATLTVEWVLIKPEMSRRSLKRLAKIDGLYGLSAILVVSMGFLLWLKVGKPAEFYNGNHIFYTKVGLAVLVGLLSIYPTIFFAKQSKGKDLDEMVVIPASIRKTVTVELILMAIIPLLATLMAGGIG